MLHTAPVAWQGSGCVAGHSGSRMVVAPSTESSGTGSARNVPSGRSRHPLSKFSTTFFSVREALPLDRRTSRCRRHASRSAARPWTAWGCYGSGKRWTGMSLGSFFHSHAQGWSCLWHTCVAYGEAVSEPTWLQWSISWDLSLMDAFALLWASFSFAPSSPSPWLSVILGAGLGRGAPLCPTSTYPLVIRGQWIW